MYPCLPSVSGASPGTCANMDMQHLCYSMCVCVCIWSSVYECRAVSHVHTMSWIPRARCLPAQESQAGLPGGDRGAGWGLWAAPQDRLLLVLSELLPWISRSAAAPPRGGTLFLLGAGPGPCPGLQARPGPALLSRRTDWSPVCAVGRDQVLYVTTRMWNLRTPPEQWEFTVVMAKSDTLRLKSYNDDGRGGFFERNTSHRDASSIIHWFICKNSTGYCR